MRYIAIIALIDFLALAGLLLLFPGGLTDVGGALLLSGMICAIGIPLAIVAGIPALWLARRMAIGSWVPLAFLGALTGPLIPMLVLAGNERNQMMFAGAFLGLLSAILWWALVERFPDRRAHYD